MDRADRAAYARPQLRSMRSPVPISQAPRFVPFGKFLLLERLAIGGMAEVYLAKSFERGEVSELLAVKRILPMLAADNEFIRMFLDEAKIAGQLAHPGIVKILELGRVGASHYLAMDYVWGKDLLAILRRCRLLGAHLAPSFVAWVGANMCEALAHAHEKRDRHGRAMNIIHRDVSPQNVLVSFDGKVKVIDFGIAKAASRSTNTQAGVLKGKVGYMSPEQVRGLTIDHRSDLFAVGTCLYELLTLRTLFARDNNFEAMENVREVRMRPLPQLRPDVPDALADIVHRALQRDPNARWQTAREMQQALSRFLRASEPSFDRVSAVAWLRDAFRKEFHTERVRLDAFDQLGRRQLSPVDEPRRHSVTDLEIGNIGSPTLPDWDEEAETLVLDEPLNVEPTTINPADEIYFSSAETSIPPEALGPLETSLPGVVPAAQFSPVTPFVPAAVEGDVSLDPNQINSGVIRQLMPPGTTSSEGPSPEEKKAVAREPTAKHRVLRDRDLTAQMPPRPPPARTWLLQLVLGLALLGAGAAFAILWTTLGAKATIEVRTIPTVPAIVLLDGARQGVAPLRLENVPPGEHSVILVADGYRDVRRDIEVGPNGTAIVEVALVPRGE